MPIIKGVEWTFDTVASKYEKLRPGYTDELYKMIFDYITIDSLSNVVEVGIGGGQATLPILKTGCTLTGIECGENFSKLCEEKFKEYQKFSVITDKFENVSFSAKEYTELLGTYSDHIAIEETIRTEFFSKIEETINQYGGSYTLYDTIDLQLARKP